MNAGTRRGLTIGATLLVAIAALGNIGHTYTHAIREGQQHQMALVIACLPDVMLILCVLRLRHDRHAGWAWLGLAASGLLVGWASIATAGDGLGAKIIAVAPLLGAVIAAGLLEGRSTGPTLEQVQADATRALDQARRETAQHVAAAVEQARRETSAAADERLTQALHEAGTTAAERLTAAVQAARDEVTEQAEERLVEALRRAQATAEHRLSETIAQVRAESVQQQADAVAQARLDEQHHAEQRQGEALEQARCVAREDLQEALAVVERHTAQQLAAAVEQARRETSAAADERLTAALRQAETAAGGRLSETIAQVRAESVQQQADAVSQALADAAEHAAQQQAEAVSRARREALREARTTAGTIRGSATSRRGRGERIRLVRPREDGESTSPVLDALQQALDRDEKALSPKQLCDATGLPRATVNRHLDCLQVDGEVTRVERGRYQATTPTTGPAPDLDGATAAPAI